MPSADTLIAATNAEEKSNPLQLVTIEAQIKELSSGEMDQAVSNQYRVPTVCRALGQQNNTDGSTCEGMVTDIDNWLKPHMDKRRPHDLSHPLSLLIQEQSPVPPKTAYLNIISPTLEIKPL